MNSWLAHMVYAIYTAFLPQSKLEKRNVVKKIIRKRKRIYKVQYLEAFVSNRNYKWFLVEYLVFLELVLVLESISIRISILRILVDS